MSSRIARAFRMVSERMRIDSGKPLSEMSDQVVGVVQVASPLFADDEVDFFAGGGRATSAPGLRPCVGLIANVDLLVYAAWQALGVNAYYFTDPNQPTGATSVEPTVKPWGRTSQADIVTGTRSLATVDPLQSAQSYALGIPFLTGGARPLLLKAGVGLWACGDENATLLQSYAWTEFPL